MVRWCDVEVIELSYYPILTTNNNHSINNGNFRNIKESPQD